jgi:hypothetical protein
MRNALNLFALLIVWVLSSSCTPHTPPETELCIQNNDQTMGCDDPRLPDDQQTYTRSTDETINYLCTNPRDYMAIKDYCIDLRSALIKCEKRRSKP